MTQKKTCIAPTTEDGRGGVYSRSFLALVATQFFVSLNDNMFRWLVVPIGKELMGKNLGEMPNFIQDWMKPESLAYRWVWRAYVAFFSCSPRRPDFWRIASANAALMVACKVGRARGHRVRRRRDCLRQCSLMFLTLFILGGQAMMCVIHLIEAWLHSGNCSSRQDFGGQRVSDQHGLDGGHHPPVSGRQLAL